MAGDSTIYDPAPPMKVARVGTVLHPEFPNLGWVLVEAADGQLGLGETFFNIGAVSAYIHEIVAPYLLGQDPLNTSRHAEALSRQWGRGGIGAEARASSAVDIALWDLKAKHLGVPLFELLGGASRPSVGVYNTCGGPGYGRSLPLPGNLMTGLGSGAFEDLRAFQEAPGDLAADLLKNGIPAMKVWPFDVVAQEFSGRNLTSAGIRRGRECLDSIRAAVGFEMDIALELHGKWDVPSARRLVQALGDLELMWIEDPIRTTTPAAMADVRAVCSTPLVVSETLGTPSTFLEYLSAGAVDVVMADPLWVGGVTGARQVAELAALFDRPFTPHDCTGPVGLAVGVHICVSSPNAIIQEFVRAYYFGWYRELAVGLPILEKGRMTPPQTAGHGVELRPEFLDDCAIVWATS